MPPLERGTHTARPGDAPGAVGNQRRQKRFSVVTTSRIGWTASSDPMSAAQPSCNAADKEQRSSDFSYSGIRVQNFLPRPPRFHFSSQSSWQQLPSPGSKGSCNSMLLCVLFAKDFGVKSFSQGFFFLLALHCFFRAGNISSAIPMLFWTSHLYLT